MIFYDLLAVVPLIGAAKSDRKTRSIPNAYVFAVLLCAAAKVLFTPYPLKAAFSGGVFVGGIFLVWSVATDAFGGGDVKLASALGCLMGWRSAMRIMLTALCIGCFDTIRRREKRGALAPYILISAIIFTVIGGLKYV